MPRRISETDRTFMTAYGPALRQALAVAGHSGSTLARALHLREFQLQRWLRGEGTPPSPQLQEKITTIVGPIRLNGVGGSPAPEATSDTQDRLSEVVEMARRDIAAAAGRGIRPSQVAITIQL